MKNLVLPDGEQSPAAYRRRIDLVAGNLGYVCTGCKPIAIEHRPSSVRASDHDVALCYCLLRIIDRDYFLLYLRAQATCEGVPPCRRTIISRISCKAGRSFSTQRIW